MSDKRQIDPLKVKVTFRVTQAEFDALQDIAAESNQSVGGVIRKALGTPISKIRTQILGGRSEIYNLEQVLREYEELFLKLYRADDPRASRLRRAQGFVAAERLTRLERNRAPRKST